MDYWLHILILIGIYTILASSLNLVAGYTGLISVAHAVFYAIGAYTGALLALRLHAPFLVSLVCAVALSSLLSVLLAVPCLRIRDDYFAIATFALQVMAYSVLNNWVSLTGGPMGLPGIPEPTILGWRMSSRLDFLILVSLLSGSALWICWRIVTSPFGRVLKAIREDEVYAQAIGKHVAAYKTLVFAIGAGIAAVAGVVYAHYISFIDPTSFTVMESVFIIAIVVIGGAGSLRGSVVGAATLIALPELLRFIGLPSQVAASIRQVLYGVILVAVMMWRPRGLLGGYAFEKGGPQG